MQSVPAFNREGTFEISFSLRDITTPRESPALSESVNVGVDGKGGHPEGLRHHNAGGLVPNPGQRLQGVHRAGDRPAVVVDEHLREAADVSGLGRGEPEGADAGQDRLDRLLRHALRAAGQRPEPGSDLVDLLVCGLRREEHCDQEGIRVGVVERRRRLWVEVLQDVLDALDLFSFFHASAPMESSVERVGLSEGEGGDLRIELLAVLGDHLVGSVHGPKRGVEGAAGGVAERLAGPEDRLLADDARSADVLLLTLGVGDDPVPRDQLDGLTSLVGDGDMVDVHPAMLAGVGSGRQVLGLNLDKHTARDHFTHGFLSGSWRHILLAF